MESGIIGVALALLLASRLAAASPAELDWDRCLKMQGSPEERLACYDRQAKQLHPPAAREHAAAAPEVESAAKPAPPEESGLAGEWGQASGEKAFVGYKPNYLLLLASSSQPNNTPTSPNPQNQVPASYPLDSREAKFQVSFKSKIHDLFGGSLWAGYTQQSYWQVYDGPHSRPFRESNYEPELIFSHPLQASPIIGFSPRILNFAIVHQSNGQSLPRSRSWNRVYAQLGLERDLDGGDRLTLLLRPWWRIRENPANDDNPDITSYLGYGDAEVRFRHGKAVWSLIARIRSAQFDLAYHLIGQLNMHLQYFTGYGESLIDYNQRHDNIGIGISLPY